MQLSLGHLQDSTILGRYLTRGVFRECHQALLFLTFCWHLVQC